MQYLTERQFLTDLFAGPFPGHALIVDPEWAPMPWPEDPVVSEGPVKDWLPLVLRNYELMVERHEALGDDSVPYARLWTGTTEFAQAFGCEVHKPADTPAHARPLVRTAAEADRLETPAVTAPPLDRLLELAGLAREALGPEVPIGAFDVQSPFDIAALVWSKQDLFLAMYEQPEAVHRLVDKCEALLTGFLSTFKAEFPECNLCHCPTGWAPPELGCWLSEDEAGSLSVGMFEEFCLPSLQRLSEAFGGLFMHCCATADHQYASFRKIPRLRGLNRVFQAPGPRPAVEAFAGETVLIVGWTDEAGVRGLLELARPDTRFLFNLGAMPLDQAERSYEQVRELCPRR